MYSESASKRLKSKLQCVHRPASYFFKRLASVFKTRTYDPLLICIIQYLEYLNNFLSLSSSVGVWLEAQQMSAPLKLLGEQGATVDPLGT